MANGKGILRKTSAVAQDDGGAGQGPGEGQDEEAARGEGEEGGQEEGQGQDKAYVARVARPHCHALGGGLEVPAISWRDGCCNRTWRSSGAPNYPSHDLQHEPLPSRLRNLLQVRGLGLGSSRHRSL